MNEYEQNLIQGNVMPLRTPSPAQIRFGPRVNEDAHARKEFHAVTASALNDDTTERLIRVIRALEARKSNKYKALCSALLRDSKYIFHSNSVDMALNTMDDSDTPVLVDYSTICSKAFTENYSKVQKRLILPAFTYNFIEKQLNKQTAPGIVTAVLADCEKVYLDKFPMMPYDLYNYLCLAEEETDIMFARYAIVLQEQYPGIVMLILSPHIIKIRRLIESWPK